MAFDEDVSALRQRIDERRRGRERPDFPPGARVWIERGGKWRPGVVVGALDARVRVRFDGWLARGDQEVGLDRVAPYDRPPPGPQAGRSELFLLIAFVMAIIGAMMATAIGEGAPATAPEGARRIRSIADVHVGQQVWVSTGDSWYPGTIDSIDATRSTVRVQLDGDSDPSDEDFPLHHVRTH